MVNRCICFKRTFAELKRIADEHDAKTIDELRKHVSFGMSCMLCVPYVEKMLATGEVEFEVQR